MSVVLQCREAMALLTDGTDGALHGMTAMTLSIHLTACRPCSRYKKQVERALELLAALTPKPASEGEIDAIMAMLKA